MKLRFPRTTSYDLPLVLVVLALLLLGLAMVYSASGITALDANEDPGMFLAQLCMVGQVTVGGIKVVDNEANVMPAARQAIREWRFLSIKTEKGGIAGR